MQKLIDGYYSWLKDNTLTKQVGEYVEITTPFVDRHNDCIQFYAKLQSNGKYYITDDGYTLSDLQMSGVDITTPKRKKFLNNILLSYGVKISKDNELFISGSQDDIYIKKHFFIQAILDINNLCFTSRATVTSLFAEDVSMYLEKHDIRFLPDIQLVGKSGLPRKIDFAISKSKKSPERYLQLANVVNRQTTDNIIFSWEDLKHVRKASKMIVFLNDEKQKVNHDLVQAFTSYNIKPMLWSEREDNRNLEILVG